MISEEFLKIVDGIHPFLCHLVIAPVVYPGHQDIFIMRTVKHLDHAFCWCVFMNPPEKIMGKLFLCRDLEGLDHHSLWIESAKNIPDYTIFAAGVHALEYHQH